MKIAAFLTSVFLIFIATSSPAQYCLNPSARLQRLKSPALTKDSLRKFVREEMEFIQLKPHDTVADIGSFDGYYPALYSLFSDSVVFYLNDITNAGFPYFDSIKFLCENIKGQPFSNKFTFVTGTDSSSSLPKKTFDKVILKDVLHHVTQTGKMLEDIKSIMKPQAVLLLYEPLWKEQSEKDNLCRGAMNREELQNLMQKHGFVQTQNKNGTERSIMFTAENGSYYWLEYKRIDN